MAEGKIYFTQFEKELILHLAKPFLTIVENKETNGVTSSKKAKAYNKIAERFNSTDGVTPRTVKQIRQCYLNLRKKINKKAACQRQESPKTGGGQFPKEVQLSTLEMEFKAEPIWTTSDSDTTEIERLDSQDGAAAFTLPIMPVQNAETSLELNQSLDIESSDSSCAETPEPAETSGVKNTPKPSYQNLIRESLMMSWNRHQKSTAPSAAAAARAAACIEAEHVENAKYVKQQAEAAEKEHELRIELLREQIKTQKKKTEVKDAGTPEPAETSGVKDTLKPSYQNSLRESLIMSRKRHQKSTAPSAVARAAACIEAEHVENAKYVKQQAEAAEKEHELRIELLIEQIKTQKKKTEVQDALINLIKNSSELDVLKILLNKTCD